MKKISFYEYSGFLVDGKIVDDLALLPLSEAKKIKLQQISESAFPGKSLFSISQRKIRAGSIVGVISFDGVQVEILPKLLKKHDSTNDQSILQNLMFMLSYTNQVDILNSGVGLLATDSDSFIEAYIAIFATGLITRLQRHGIPKKYVVKNENLNVLRGRVLFSQNLACNSFNKSKVFCEFSEFTEDCPLSAAFKFVSERLQKLTKSSQNFNLLSKCIGLLDGIRSDYIRPEELDKESTIAKDKSFISLINLTKMFLKRLRPNFSKKHTSEIFTLLFDMNELFEEFIFKVIKRNEQALGVQVFFQKGKRLVNAERDYFEDGRWIERKLFNTFTDIMVKTSKGHQIVIDTKYKMISSEENHYGIKNDDIYQILTYKLLYQDDKGLTNVVLLYPKNQEDIKKQLRVNSSRENTVYTFTLDISTDLKSNIPQIVSEIKKFIAIAS